MSDIVERAEAALAGRTVGDRVVSAHRFWTNLVRELVAELKVARAEVERLRDEQTRLRILNGMLP